MVALLIAFISRVSPLYKNLNLLKINDIYILEMGKLMHNLHWGRIPVNFDHLFTSVNRPTPMQLVLPHEVDTFGNWLRQSKAKDL